MSFDDQLVALRHWRSYYIVVGSLGFERKEIGAESSFTTFELILGNVSLLSFAVKWDEK